MSGGIKRYNHAKGSAGEEKAVGYISSLGYGILYRNYRTPAGEIDIIAKDGDCTVFIEVKYRKNINYGTPAEAVNYRKQAKIRNTALYYLSALGRDDIPMRFDVIGILGSEITHIKNAF